MLTRAQILHVRLLKYMERKGMNSADPSMPDSESAVGAPILNLNLMYIEKAKGFLLRVSNSVPWKRRSHWLKDYWIPHYGSLTPGMKHTKAG